MSAEPDTDEAFMTLPAPQAGGRVWAILAADRAREHARARRQGLVAVLAALSLPVWVAAIWPQRLPDQWRSFAAAAWALAFGGVLLALAAEVLARGRRARQIATLGPLPALRSARGQAATATRHDRAETPAAMRDAGAACAAPAEDED